MHIEANKSVSPPTPPRVARAAPVRVRAFPFLMACCVQHET